MHLKSQKKVLSISTAMFKDFSLGVKIRPIHVYFKSNRQTHCVHTFESYNFLSGQTNKEKLPYVVYERSLTTPY